MDEAGGSAVFATPHLGAKSAHRRVRLPTKRPPSVTRYSRSNCHQSEMAPVEPPTYRLSRIPAQVSGPDLGHFLCEVIPGLDLKQIRIGSLAPTPDDHNKPPTQTATIQIFGLHPQAIEFDSNGECAKEIKGHRRPLLIDRHFLGFTPLNHVDSGTHAFE